MAVLKGKTAPERVDELSPLWADLAPAQRVELGCRWVDLAVRSLLPLAFEKVGHHGVGAVLRTLPAITNLEALRFAHDQLLALNPPTEHMGALGAYLSVGTFLHRLVEDFEISDCCFLTVMTSRHVFGDDRAIEFMLSAVAKVRGDAT